ncbi:MAG TPA: glucose 1-dehydrogenase [Roseiflexaceae bacterium]|nr:glucose 1-dehydrogenase [Roseiflexaceae bacterium]
MQELFSLEGRVALVTGASGGIGRAIATGLASAGATLAVNGRAVDRLEAVCGEIEAANGTAAAFPADLSDRRAIPALVDEVVARFGQIDILVTCAGANRRMPIKDVTPEIYDAIMASNLDSIFFLSQAVLPHLVARGGGKIVNIGSLTSSIGLMNVSVYGITKSAVAQLTKTMAIEWAEHNIQVNCLCPGFIATELTAPLWADPQRSQWMLDRIPSKRAGRPEDLVGMAIYMASAASNYTTGQSIYVDGGFTVGSQW